MNASMKYVGSLRFCILISFKRFNLNYKTGVFFLLVCACTQVLVNACFAFYGRSTCARVASDFVYKYTELSLQYSKRLFVS